MQKGNTVTIKNILSPGSHLKDRLIPDLKELKNVVEDLKRMGYKIVLTQGVYDMLHEGHAIYLEKAQSLGDILVLGVDSDELTRLRKGPGRPIVPQSERVQMLSHLRSIGILTIREVKHGMGKLIETVRPDVLVLSQSTKDFGKKEAAVYKKYCKEIVVLPPQASTHTSARIRTLTISGADELAQDIMKGVPELVKHALNKFRNK
jgi:D-beta-D-heptose 7-phosphate kinase/D-beta-D-heptose 1-phosphate adenosyltransferase